MTFQRTMKVIAAINDDEYLQKITNNIASFEDIRMIASSKHATDRLVSRTWKNEQCD